MLEKRTLIAEMMYQVNNWVHFLGVQDNNLIVLPNVLVLVGLAVDCSIVEEDIVEVVVVITRYFHSLDYDN